MRRFGFLAGDDGSGASSSGVRQGDVCKTVETVPDDFFEACKVKGSGCRQESVPQVLKTLQVQYMARVEGVKGRPAPTLYAMQVPCQSTFGGRWFAPGYKGAPRESIVVILTGGEYEKAVLLHEMTHWKRWKDAGDKLGRHDQPFLNEVEPVYKAFGISKEVAKAVEHEPRGFMAGGQCYGQACDRRGRAGGRAAGLTGTNLYVLGRMVHEFPGLLHAEGTVVRIQGSGAHERRLIKFGALEFVAGSKQNLRLSEEGRSLLLEHLGAGRSANE